MTTTAHDPDRRDISPEVARDWLKLDPRTGKPAQPYNALCKVDLAYTVARQGDRIAQLERELATAKRDGWAEGWLAGVDDQKRWRRTEQEWTGPTPNPYELEAVAKLVHRFAGDTNGCRCLTAADLGVLNAATGLRDADIGPQVLVANPDCALHGATAPELRHPMPWRLSNDTDHDVIVPTGYGGAALRPGDYFTAQIEVS